MWRGRPSGLGQQLGQGRLDLECAQQSVRAHARGTHQYRAVRGGVARWAHAAVGQQRQVGQGVGAAVTGYAHTERERERAGLHCTTRRNGAPVNVARYAVDSLRDVVGATFLPFRPYRLVLRLGDGGDMEPVDRSSIVLVRDHSREAAVVGISSRQCDDSDGAWVCAAISCQISSSDRLELCG